ncbi:hypothetical protein ABE459_03985 [Pseudomonas sp. TWI923]|uniref:hypothetical protein n=1 Tax=Pseudomonas sp. TWI923 TaxID=3136794 RepID=UPI00320923F2
MPTENRSSNTEMVSAPRELIEFAVGFKTHGHKNLTEQKKQQRHAQEKLRAILAQPAEQRHGEQAAPFKNCIDARAYIADLFITRLRRHDFDKYIRERLAGDFAFALANWMTGEDERLRSDLQKEVFRRQSDESAYSAVARQNDTLRAQMAERDALLRDLEGKTILSWPEKRRISAALSASAEPSAPASCTWTYNDDSFAWDTTCSESFLLMDDGPKENCMKFCCYCSKPIIQAPHKAES